LRQVPLYHTALSVLRNKREASAHRIEAHNCNFQCGVSSNTGGGALTEFTLRIDGMHCGSCIRRVSRALSSAPGMTVEEVRIGAARLTSKEDSPPIESALAALAKAGYTAHLET
jgi:copper chaperone